MLAYQQILSLLIILLVIIFLYKELFRPSVVFLMAVVLFMVSGILTPQEALAGFSNTQIVTVILLLVISNIIRKTAVIDGIFNKLFRHGFSYKGFIGRMMLYVAGTSAFLNNTPLVAMLIPYVHDWGKKNGIAPSKILIPLSYAAILGGMTTLIGTKIHLITSGFVLESGLPALDIFDFTYVGLPLIFIGTGYMLLVGHRLLPEKKDVLDDFAEKSREYIAETVILEGSSLIGKSIEEAGLRHLKGLFLVEILRAEQKIAPVAPDEILRKGDRLIFAGVTDTIIDLIQSNKGLSVYKFDTLRQQEKIDIVEAVVPPNSSLKNKKVRDSNFRGIYDAAIIGIHRNGEKLSGKIGSIKLAAGDLLLLITGKNFEKITHSFDDFYVLSKVHEIRNLDLKKAVVSLGGLITVILCAVIFGFALFKGLLLFLCLMLVFRIVRIDEVKESIDLELFAILGFALAMGKAFIQSGTAEMLAQSMVSVAAPFGIIGIMVGLYILTSVLAGLMNSTAALSVTFPIALAAAATIGVEPIPLALLVSFAAAANFITPFGYATNLMVYGPGGYVFKDFIRVGFPLTLIYMISTILILSFIYF